MKRAVKLVIESPATVGLGLRAQLFIMSLTTLSSLCWSWCVDTVVGQACQRVGCTVTVCGSHVKRVVKSVVELPATVGLGLCYQLFIMSLTTLPSLRWCWCVDTLVGQACQRVGLHSNCLRPPREACCEIDRLIASDSGVGSLLSVIHHVSHVSLFAVLELMR